MKRILVALCVVGCTSAWGQQVTDRRSAEIRGGGGEGKCTIEVEVDDVAEIEINGSNAIIRTINGSPASFRRFQCNQAMPNRPAGFRFKGIDGRGRQDMIRSAEDGGRAIIRIEDSKGGREGYTFDIFWSGSGGGFGRGNGGGIFGGNNRGGNGNGGGWNNSGGGWNNGWGNGGGWNNSGDFNFEGGNRGSGTYRDRNGDRRRLDRVRVTVSRSGDLRVEFQGERGRMEFSGPVDRRQGRRIFSNVRNSEMTGLMEIEMGSGNAVSRITIRDIDLSWSN